MQYKDLICYEDKEELLRANLIWDSRRFFILNEASNIVRKNDLIVALYNKRMVFIYDIDLLQLRNGILIGKYNRYSIQESISGIEISSISLVWYNNSVHLCIVYS